MKFKAIIFLLSNIFSFGLQGQGLILNDVSYQNSPKKTFDNNGAKSEVAILKDKFKVDLKLFCPSVREQGKISSCVGWSVGYAAMTIEKAIANHWEGQQKTIDDNAYSAMFVYNQIKLGDCNFGAELNKAFSFLKEKGNVLYRDFASDSDCDSIPFANLMERASVNRLGDFATLFNPEEKADMKIERVKVTLANNKPVVIGMVVLDNFLSLKSTDRMWYPNIGKTTMFGGHAMVVIGYDDGLQAFEVMNSWGKGWANQGFAWIRYEDFAKYCKYAYQLILVKDNAPHLEGNIQVRKPVMKVLNSESNTVFSALPFEYKDNLYKLKNQNVKFPFQFQLIADGLVKGSYLYIISFNKNMMPTVHWPRDENLDRRFADEFESAMVPGSDFKVMVPGKYNVFSITEPGTEYLCVLNSNTQIKNLPERLKQVANGSGDIQDRLHKAFNKITFDFTAQFNNEQISYYALTKKDAIVSVLLAFETQQ